MTDDITTIDELASELADDGEDVAEVTSRLERLAETAGIEDTEDLDQFEVNHLTNEYVARKGVEAYDHDGTL
jgi:hypothetical protein